MNTPLLKINNKIINVERVADVVYEPDNGRVTVHMSGSAPETFHGKEAATLWEYLSSQAHDLIPPEK